MSENSKERHKLLQDVNNKAKERDLDFIKKLADFASNPKSWQKKIEAQTYIPSDKEIETQRFIICFDYFNKNICEFEQFDPAKGKKLLEILEQVAKCEINKFPHLKLIRDSVTNTTPYKSLFSTVTPDVDKIHETELCDGRIFFFITGSRFHIVSIETKHRNLHYK